MNANKLQIKLFTDAAPPLASFTPVFHAFIKRHTLGELLIDVANYAHVPDGPGVGIVGHGSDFFMDQTEGRLGLLYSRKRLAPPPAQRLSDAFRRAINMARLLETDPNLAGKVRFRTDEWLFRINDRLAAPNTDDAFVAIRPTLQAFFADLFTGVTCDLEPVGEPRQLFAVRIKTPAAPTLETLLDRLGGPPPSEEAPAA
jgi:hypothetical protein